jgi:hypothetical protein
VVRVQLPAPLRRLAQIDGEVLLDLASPVTQSAVLGALETRYPPLLGTIRDPVTRRRRAYVRLYGSGLDLSNADPDALLPDAVASGREPFMVIGAIAGG